MRTARMWGHERRWKKRCWGLEAKEELALGFVDGHDYGAFLVDGGDAYKERVIGSDSSFRICCEKKYCMCPGDRSEKFKGEAAELHFDLKQREYVL